MNYGNIIYYDIANGEGVRTSLFVSGCRHHCKGCFNEMTWNFQYGEPFTTDTKNEILESLKLPAIDGLTILGGEPFEPENQPTILDLITAVRQTVPNKSIWCYSGYTWEELTGQLPSIAHCDITNDILKQIDILVDGPFVLEKRNLMLNYRGSGNQRIIDVPASLKATDGIPIITPLNN